MFSNQALRKLIIPIFLDQLLIITVGIIATMMVSYVGEAAVSGVSLVDMINMLLINILAALTTGGAVIVSQYIGHKDKGQACNAASQLITISSISYMFILRILFGYILGIVFNMGVIGIWIAMGGDWLLRSIIYIVRFKGGKWKNFQVI